MGDPRKFTNKYENPKKLWTVQRIKEESALKTEFGLKSMRELWVMAQELKKVRREARRLLSLTEEERKVDEETLMAKLARLDILKQGSKVEDVLSLTSRDVLERRLQSRVYRKGLAKSMKQARQLITHGFIAIGDRKVSAPSYLVTAAEDSQIAYYKPIDLAISEKEEEEEEAEETPAEAKPAEAAPAEKKEAPAEEKPKAEEKEAPKEEKKEEPKKEEVKEEKKEEPKKEEKPAEEAKEKPAEKKEEKPPEGKKEEKAEEAKAEAA